MSFPSKPQRVYGRRAAARWHHPDRSGQTAAKQEVVDLKGRLQVMLTW